MSGFGFTGYFSVCDTDSNGLKSLRDFGSKLEEEMYKKEVPIVLCLDHDKYSRRYRLVFKGFDNCFEVEDENASRTILVYGDIFLCLWTDGTVRSFDIKTIKDIVDLVTVIKNSSHV